MTAYTKTSFRSSTPLTEEQLFQIAPSVFAVEAHESRSERFQPIPTVEVLRRLAKEGFHVYAAKQGRSRIPGKAPFTRHDLRLRHDSYRDPIVGGTFLEMQLLNAQDGTSAYRLSLAALRVICLNGLCVSDSYEHVNVRHTGTLDTVSANVIEGTFHVLGAAPRVIEAIENWQGIKLEREEARLFATSAHMIRYPEAHLAEDDVNYKAAPVTPERLLTARRWADQDDTLWNVFNRAQENSIRSGLRGTTVRDGRVVRATTREVTGIDADQKINKALWALTEGMAALKQAA